MLEPGLRHVDAITLDRSLVGFEQFQAALLQASSRAPIRAYHAPPGHAATELCHDVAHLAGSTASHHLGNVTVGRYLARWYLLDQTQHQFGVIVIHRVTSPGCQGRP
jgi:hypothetical protein